jgi:hypothetical protein
VVEAEALLAIFGFPSFNSPSMFTQHFDEIFGYMTRK